MSYVNTVSIINDECNIFNGGRVVATSCSPGIVDICETPSNGNGATYIRVFNDGKNLSNRLESQLVEFVSSYFDCLS